MRILSFTLVLLSFFTVVAHGEENAASDDVAPSAPTQFLVTLAEYRLDQPIPVEATETEILESVRRSKVTPVETVRMTAGENSENLVNFGRQVSVTAGTVSRGPVTSKQFNSVQIGTVLKVRLVSHTDGVQAEIDYSTSRVAANGTEDSPPDVVSNTVQTTQVYALGKQRLIAMSSVGDASCIVVSIQRLP